MLSQFVYSFQQISSSVSLSFYESRQQLVLDTCWLMLSHGNYSKDLHDPCD
jgi:hypothetical protein